MLYLEFSLKKSFSRNLPNTCFLKKKIHTKTLQNVLKEKFHILKQTFYQIVMLLL